MTIPASDVVAGAHDGRCRGHLDAAGAVATDGVDHAGEGGARDGTGVDARIERGDAAGHGVDHVGEPLGRFEQWAVTDAMHDFEVVGAGNGNQGTRRRCPVYDGILVAPDKQGGERQLARVGEQARLEKHHQQQCTVGDAEREVPDVLLRREPYAHQARREAEDLADRERVAPQVEQRQIEPLEGTQRCSTKRSRSVGFLSS